MRGDGRSRGTAVEQPPRGAHVQVTPLVLGECVEEVTGRARMPQRAVQHQAGRLHRGQHLPNRRRVQTGQAGRAEHGQRQRHLKD